MKKGLLPLTLAAIVLAACGGKQPSATATAADSAATNVQAAGQTNTYLSTIDSFLVNELGKLYAEGEYCVPTYTIVGVDSQRLTTSSCGATSGFSTTIRSATR